MKILVTGAAGQLGHDVMNRLDACGHDAVGSDKAASYNGSADGSAVTRLPYISMDITDRESVDAVIGGQKPDAVIHCAAWTAVDAAEDPQNQSKVTAVNTDGTRHIAEACSKYDCRMMYISTDYVFGGLGTKPWEPDCRDFAPQNIYGKTKLAGELAVSEILNRYFIIRIAWVFGTNGKNFIKTMLQAGKTHNQIRVVDDQIGTPTYTYDLARLLVDMIETDRYGYYHATNEGGYISWYDFTKEIFRQASELGHPEYQKDNLTVIPVTTQEYGMSKAVRPFNSRLDKTKLAEKGFTPLPDWKDALSRYLSTITF